MWDWRRYSIQYNTWLLQQRHNKTCRGQVYQAWGEIDPQRCLRHLRALERDGKNAKPWKEYFLTCALFWPRHCSTDTMRQKFVGEQQSAGYRTGTGVKRTNYSKKYREFWWILHFLTISVKVLQRFGQREVSLHWFLCTIAMESWQHQQQDSASGKTADSHVSLHLVKKLYYHVGEAYVVWIPRWSLTSLPTLRLETLCETTALWQYYWMNTPVTLSFRKGIYTKMRTTVSRRYLYKNAHDCVSSTWPNRKRNERS